MADIRSLKYVRLFCVNMLFLKVLLVDVSSSSLVIIEVTFTWLGFPQYDQYRTCASPCLAILSLDSPLFGIFKYSTPSAYMRTYAVLFFLEEAQVPAPPLTSTPFSNHRFPKTEAHLDLYHFVLPVCLFLLTRTCFL